MATAREIRLAPHETKNGKEFVLPLTGIALEIVKDLLVRGRRTRRRAAQARRPRQGVQQLDALARRLERETGFHFNWHDMRRAFASEAGEHGLGTFHLIDSLLNHSASATRSGAVRSYHHAVERPAKLAVMLAWDSLVACAVENGAWPRQMQPSDNVVPLASGRAS